MALNGLLYNTTMEITEVIYVAIDMMKKSFGGSDVELLSNELIRKKYSGINKFSLGVYIKICGIKTFFRYEVAEDMVITPSSYGQRLADEFVLTYIKLAYPDKFVITRIYE